MNTPSEFPTRCRDYVGNHNGACPYDVHDCAGMHCKGCQNYPNLCSCGSNRQFVPGGPSPIPIERVETPALYFVADPVDHSQMLVASFEARPPANSVCVTTNADIERAADNPQIRLPSTVLTVHVFRDLRVATAYAEGAAYFDDISYAVAEDHLNGLAFAILYSIDEDNDDAKVHVIDHREI